MKKKGKLQIPYFTFSVKSVMNKYVIATACLFIWLAFFDKNDLATNYKLGKTIEKLEIEKTDLEEKIVEIRKRKKDVEENQEKFAREKFYMHKDNEDVIVIEKKK
ncbi:MAG: hypothetical protein V3V14_13805 [Saprospiraceae bacterium]